MKLTLFVTAAAIGIALFSASARPIIGLTDNNELVHFDSASPGSIVTTVPIRGLFGTEKMESIDIRPHDGLLYGLAVAMNPNQPTAILALYAINPVNGIATRVDSGSAGSDQAPLRYGFDFDPTNDVLRVVNAADQNRRLDLHTGQAVANDSNLSDNNSATSERILAIAYDRNDSSDATASTLYGINFDTDQLVRIGGVDGQPSPNGGVVTPIGPLGFQTDDLEMGFDIAQDGTAYASLLDGPAYGLYTIDLASGAATPAGTIGDGKKVIRGLAVPFDESLPPPAFTVLNTNASGADSLRQAIVRSTAHPGLDTITFDIPGPGPHVILLSPGFGLPAIRDATIIDGTTEPSFDPTTREPVVGIDLNPIMNSLATSGFTITEEFAHGSQIRGLRITNFRDFSQSGAGIRVNSNDVVITGNYIGTDGSNPLGNGTGIAVTGENCVIGGTSPADRNVISSNPVQNISLSGNNAQVLGNYIGTDAVGTGRPNATQVVGVQVHQDGSGHTIGGSAAGARNIISGNARGVILKGTASVVAGNYIGTNVAGDAAIPNDVGIEITGAGGHTIGAAGDGPNVISGNKTTGVALLGSTQGNVLRNNWIGLSATGAQLANGGAGVQVAGGSNLNSIGQPGAGNVIAFNGGAGVSVEGAGTVLNVITGNSMFSNAGLGIDLNNDGVTANDNGDADSGPNALQNFPVLTTAANKGNGTILVEGSLNSIPNVTYRIELYTTDAVDPSGNGEGRISLGSLTAATDSTGNLTFSQTFPIAAGAFVTATAEAAGSTSEFSPAITIAGPKPGVLANISTRLQVGTADNVLIGGFIITGMQPKKVIIRAIGPSLAVEGPLADPQIEVYNSAGELVASNNNWRDNANQQEIIDTTIAPPDDLEAAFLSSLSPGAYTAVVSGVGGGTGVGLIEVYDLDGAADSKLANIATRGFVQTGDDVLIGGLIITGEAQLKLLLRGLGPSLDIEGKLADPTLALVNANGDSVAFNNNWRDTQQAEVEATGIPPQNELEPAIVETVPPAQYTAVVRGLAESTGIAVVEVYALSN